MLSAVHDKLHDYAKAHVERICNILIFMDAKKDERGFELQTYAIKRPFGFYRLALAEILSDLIVCAPEVLDKVPIAAWRVLSSWFLEYRFNNLYHFQFWKIYQVVIRDNHVESQKALFNKYKFVSKMIDHYKSSESSAARGFIIVMCNTLRFAADLQPTTGYLKHFLVSHDIWKQFLPNLRSDTLLQQKRYDDLIYMPELAEDEADEDENGIDLGSAYARSLGFDELAPMANATDSPSKTSRKKKKKKMQKRLSKLNNSMELTATEDQTSRSDKKEGKQEVDSPTSPKQEETTEKAESPDWWNDMVSDFKEEEHKANPEDATTDWWGELKSELQQTVPTELDKKSPVQKEPIATN